MNDKTDKTQSQSVPHQDDSKFYNVIDASPVPYALNDEQQNITYLNPAFINTFGYDLSDIPTLSDWWPRAYPDEEYRNWAATTWQQHLDSARQYNEPFEALELIIQCKDKSRKNVLASAASLSGDFEGTHLVIIYDITEHTKAQNELYKTNTLLENIVNSTHDLIFVKNTQLQTIFCNKAFAKAVGKRREELYGHTDIENGWDPELVNGNPEKGIRGFMQDDKDALSGMDVHNPYDPANIEGEIRIFDTHKLPLIDAEDQTMGVLGIARDVTERKRAEEKLRHSQKMEALGKLTGGIAHDFNNMLGVILGYTELLKNKTADNPKLTRYIQEIHTAGNRARSLTSKLLAFSRKQPSDAKPCQINQLLQRDQNMLEKTLTAKVHLKLNLMESLWSTLIDEEMLADSILNMAINSMHAMPLGGTLEIATNNVHLDSKEVQLLSITEGDYVKLTLTDNGSGMDNQAAEQIFEPFFTTKGETGSGLGMSQVYGFVKQSRGDIRVYTELEQGTRIIIYLPRHLTSDDREESSKKNDNDSIIGGKETILVVDDETSLQELAKEILSLQGYRVLIADNAQQAMHILDTDVIDLLLSDVIMPEMDGYQLAVEARKKQPGIKIQMISGYNEQHYIENADKVLLQQQLHKPYSAKILLQRIRQLLDEK